MQLKNDNQLSMRGAHLFKAALLRLAFAIAAALMRDESESDGGEQQAAGGERGKIAFTESRNEPNCQRADGERQYPDAACTERRRLFSEKRCSDTSFTTSVFRRQPRRAGFDKNYNRCMRSLHDARASNNMQTRVFYYRVRFNEQLAGFEGILPQLYARKAPREA